MKSLEGAPEIERLTDFLQNASESLHLLDGTGKILWANETELRLLGYRPEEYIGHNIADFHVSEETIGDILTRLSNFETLKKLSSSSQDQVRAGAQCPHQFQCLPRGW